MKSLAVFVYTLSMGCFFNTTCTLAVGNADFHKQSGMRRVAKGLPRRRMPKRAQSSGLALDVNPTDWITLIIHDDAEHGVKVAANLQTSSPDTLHPEQVPS